MKKRTAPYLELIALLIMLAGFILRWLEVDPKAIILHLGFVGLALAGIYSAIQSKENNSRTINLITCGFIILMVTIHFIFDIQVVPLVIVGLVVQYFITQRKAKPTA